MGELSEVLLLHSWGSHWVGSSVPSRRAEVFSAGESRSNRLHSDGLPNEREWPGDSGRLGRPYPYTTRVGGAADAGACRGLVVCGGGLELRGTRTSSKSLIGLVGGGSWVPCG